MGEIRQFSLCVKLERLLWLSLVGIASQQRRPTSFRLVTTPTEKHASNSVSFRNGRWDLKEAPTLLEIIVHLKQAFFVPKEAEFPDFQGSKLPKKDERQRAM